MTEREKQIVAKLDIIESMSNEQSVKALCGVFKEFIVSGAKGKLGFVHEEEDGAES